MEWKAISTHSSSFPSHHSHLFLIIPTYSSILIISTHSSSFPPIPQHFHLFLIISPIPQHFHLFLIISTHSSTFPPISHNFHPFIIIFTHSSSFPPIPLVLKPPFSLFCCIVARRGQLRIVRLLDTLVRSKEKRWRLKCEEFVQRSHGWAVCTA